MPRPFKGTQNPGQKGHLLQNSTRSRYPSFPSHEGIKYTANLLSCSLLSKILETRSTPVEVVALVNGPEQDSKSCRPTFNRFTITSSELLLKAKSHHKIPLTTTFTIAKQANFMAGSIWSSIDCCHSQLLFLEKPVIKAHLKLDPISLSTLNCYLPRIMGCVDKEIASLLHDKVALVLDGWTSGLAHFKDVFVSSRVSNFLEYQTRLLTFLLMRDEFPAFSSHRPEACYSASNCVSLTQNGTKSWSILF